MPTSDHAQTPVLSKNRSRVCFACRAEEATHRFCYSCHCRDSQTKEVLALQIRRKELEHFRTLPYSDNRIQDFIPNTCTGKKKLQWKPNRFQRKYRSLGSVSIPPEGHNPLGCSTKIYSRIHARKIAYFSHKEFFTVASVLQGKNTFVLHICYHIWGARIYP